MANKVIIDVEARFHDKVTTATKRAQKGMDDLNKSSKEAQKTLDKVGKTKVKPQIQVEDSKFTKAIAKAKSRAEALGKTKVTTLLTAMDKASRTIDTATAKAKAYGKSRYEAVLALKDQGASAVLKKVISKGTEIAGKTWRATVTVADYATQPLRKMKDMLFNIKTLAATIFAGFAANALIKQPVSLADTITSSKIAFQTKLGSEAKAEEFLQRIYKFDEKSPFDTMQIVGITQRMMNMGWEAEGALADLEVIGDWAASMGKGEEGISRVTLALGQMRQKGKLSSEEMLQLTEAGVSGWQYLADSLGKTIPEVRKLAEDGEIDVNTAIQGIISGMQEFKGSAAANADKTVTGIIDQMKSLIQTYITLPWGEGLSAGLKVGLGDVRDLLDENKDKFKEWGLTLKQVGTEASEWLAGKVEGAIARIDALAGSDAFKNADFGGKVGMLWQTFVTDPLGQWWDSSGREALVDKGVEIGKALGTGIAKGLFEFVSGHPIAALLLGGGMGLKVAGGGSVIGGFKALGGIGSAVAGTGLLGFGTNTAIALGAGNLAGGASLGAGALSALGLGSVAGGVAGGVGIFSGLVDLYKGIKNADTASKISGGVKIGGVGAGAAAGAAIGSVIPGLGTAAGALIGAGVGGVAGMVGGSKAADSYAKSTKKAAESLNILSNRQRELMKKNLGDHFGNVALSAEQVESAVTSIVGPGRVQTMQQMQAHVEKISEAFSTLEGASSAHTSDLFFATLKRGAKITSAEVKNLKSSAKSYTDSANEYLKANQAASQQSITNLLGNSKMAEDLLEKNTKYFENQKNNLDKLTETYNTELEKALSDGTLSIDEKASLDKIRSQIADVMAKVHAEEKEAEQNKLKLQLSGDISVETFTDVIEEAQKKNKELIKSIEDDFGRATIGVEEGTAAWRNAQMGAYNNTGGVLLSTGNLGLSTVLGKYKSELGIFGKEFGELMDELSTKTMPEIMKRVDNLDEPTRNAVGSLLESMAPTADQMTTLKGKYETLISDYRAAGEKVPAELQASYDAIVGFLEQYSFYEAIAKGGDSVQEWFNDHSEYRYNPTVNVIPNVRTQPQSLFPKDFGVLDFYQANPELNINPTKNISQVTLTQSSFGIKSLYWFNPKVQVQPQTSILSSNQSGEGKGFRGGVFGGNFSNGGFVHGGAQQIIVSEEGDAEAVIPLGQRRRSRALELYNQVGKILGVNQTPKKFATGGIVGNAPLISAGGGSSPSSIQVDVGEVTIQVQGGGDGLVESIQAQKEQLAEEIAAIFNRALEAQSRNMPATKGA